MRVFSPLSRTLSSISDTTLSVPGTKVVNFFGYGLTEQFEIHVPWLQIDDHDASGEDIDLISKGYFLFLIGKKDYLVIRNHLIMSKETLGKIPRYRQVTYTVYSGKPDVAGPYVLAEPIDLIPNQSFRCELRFFEPLERSIKLRLCFDGWLKKPVV